MNEILLSELSKFEEMIFDEHDGSYELMRETIEAYSHVSDLNVIDYNDLNTVFLMSVGTWRHGVEAKKNQVKRGHLSNDNQLKLISTIDRISQNTKDGKYSNLNLPHENAFGMFGSGVFSLQNKADKPSVINFIKLCIDIKDLTDDEEMFAKAQKVFAQNFHGMKAALASMVLHCLKPMTFPILNSNMDSADIFKELDIDLVRKGDIDTYVDNCRRIKTFRDANLPFRNYRILDMKAWDIEETYRKKAIESQNIDIEAIGNFLVEYHGKKYQTPSKAGDQESYMQEFFNKGSNARIQFSNLSKLIIEEFSDFEIGKASTSGWTNQAQIVPNYFWIEFKKKGFQDTKSSISVFAEYENKKVYFKVAIALRDSNCKQEDFDKHNRIISLEIDDPALLYRVENKNSEYFFPTYGRDEIIRRLKNEEYKKIEIQTYIDGPYTNDRAVEIFIRIKNMVEELIPYYEEAINPMPIEVNGGNSNPPQPPIQGFELSVEKNAILFGPPGTGKTYNSVLYAVAIVEKKFFKEVYEEAAKDYSTVLTRYNKYQDEKLIVFTTFHQSFGYEEFIEGIKPVMNGEGNELKYAKVDGIFKKFCRNAEKPIVESSPVVFGENASIWKVTIKDGEMNDVKQDCFANSRVRIGWDDQNEELSAAGKLCTYYIEQGMQEGDIVLSLKNRRTIDGIGIVNSEGFSWLNKESEYKRSRGVQWLANNIAEDVYSINENRELVRTTIHKMTRIKIEDIIDILKKHNDEFSKTKTRKNDKNHVFIIDEINRGNISKIFGELITLIENTKRIDAKEELKARLPYTEEEFGVPSNVYIIGTLNTADRSITLMDTALRRRFKFIEMMPDCGVLSKLGITTVAGIEIAAMLNAINARIEYLYDREHTIGHAYFTGLTNESTLEDLANIFQNSIIPLLQEYFYEDYNKIQLVLGDNASNVDDKFKFIRASKITNVFKGSPDVDLPEYKYSIENDAFHLADSYKKIY